MPMDQYVAVGANAGFSVATAGSDPLTLQWQANGTNLPGATLPTLALLNVRTNSPSSFAAIAANSFGSATSTVARLSVAGSPSLLSVLVSTDSIPRITLMGLAGHTYELEGPRDFTNWVTISRFTNFSSQTTVTDPAATNSSYRFYRGRLIH